MNPFIHDSIMAEKISLFPSRKIPRGVQGSLLLLLLSRWESESDGEDEDDDDEHRQSKIHVHPSHQHGQCLTHLGPLSVTWWAPPQPHPPHPAAHTHRAACTPPPASRGRCLWLPLVLLLSNRRFMKWSISWRASHPKHLFVQLSLIN